MLQWTIVLDERDIAPTSNSNYFSLNLFCQVGMSNGTVSVYIFHTLSQLPNCQYNVGKFRKTNMDSIYKNDERTHSLQLQPSIRTTCTFS